MGKKGGGVEWELSSHYINISHKLHTCQSFSLRFYHLHIADVHSGYFELHNVFQRIFLTLKFAPLEQVVYTLNIANFKCLIASHLKVEFFSWKRNMYSFRIWEDQYTLWQWLVLLQMGVCKHVLMSVRVLYRGCFKWPSWVKHCPLQRNDLKNATPHNNLKSLLKAIMSRTPQALGSQWCDPDRSLLTLIMLFLLVYPPYHFIQSSC